MRLIRRILIALTVLLVLTLIAAVLWMASGADRLHSSPGIVRQNAAYKRVFATPDPWPPVPEDLMTDVLFITNQPYLDVAFPDTPMGSRPAMPHVLIRASAASPVQIGEGTLALEYVGIGYTIPKTNFDWGISLPMRLFTAELKPIDAEEAFPKEKRRRNLEFHGTWPQVKFLCSTANFSHLRLLGWELFDARTQWSLANRRSYGLESTGRMVLEGELQTWRPLATELVISVAAGPVTENLIPPKPGAEVRSSLGAVRLLAVYDQEMGNWSSVGKMGIESVRLEPSPPSSGYDPGPVSTFVFLAWPAGPGIPIEIEMLNSEGKLIPSHGEGSSSRLFIATARAPLKDVRQLRVRCFEKIYQVVLSLPEIPGLPEENRGIENLFDTHVPYMRLRYEYDFQAAVKDLVQMEAYHLPLVYPNGYFPITFTNTTAREMFKHMQSLAPASQQLIADPLKNRIEMREPGMVALWKWVRTFFLPN